MDMDVIDRVVNRFDQDWMLDIKTLQIKRRPRNIFRVLWEFFLPRRHNVFALYWWCKHQFHKKDQENLMAFTFPIDHDNMPIPGYPIKYEIKGNWTIPKADRKYLTKGPLARISPNEVLVPHSIGWERFIGWAKLWWPVVALIGGIMTIVIRSHQIMALFK